MKADPIFREKQTLGRYIREMVVWRLHKPVPGCRHQFKYRFFFGTDDGTCLVRYDNERGKGDHKHLAGVQLPYLFRDLEATFADFLADIATVMDKGETQNERPEDRDKKLGRIKQGDD
jgi:hypothetical protein